jgi:hypothetical protein
MQPPVTPRSEVTVITPAMATSWLEANRRNRSLSDTTVKTYAADMAAGAWHITHQGIGFDVDGALLDGQHRLSAIILANVPVAMLVTRGLPRNAQDVIDAPRVRTVKDQLQLIDGVTDATAKAATVKIVHALDNNVRSTFRLSLNQTRALIIRDGQRLDQMLGLYHGTPFKTAPFLGAMVFALGAGGRVMEFAEAVRNGEGLKRGDPAHTVRDFMLLTRRGGAVERIGTAFGVLRSVHAHIHGEQLRILRLADLMDGPLMEEILAFFRLANTTARGA